jgi:hypothetical protein
VTTIDAERTETGVAVVLGVDTHLDFHVAVAIDHLGRRLGEAKVPTTANGYEELLIWSEGFGHVEVQVRRYRRHQLLRGRAHSAPENQGD